MGDILPDLLELLKTTFRKCDDIFLENRDLRNTFSDPRLSIWQDHLPDASNLGQRVERTIHYLQSRQNAQGKNALTLFIHVLSERYSPEDERHKLFQIIIPRLQVVTPQIQQEAQNGILPEANPGQEPMLAIAELKQILNFARSVALIEITRYRKGKAEYCGTGTGWLLAPGLVLTCWHVVKAQAFAEEPPPDMLDLQLQIKHMLLSFNHIETRKGHGIQYKVKSLEYPSNDTNQQDFAILRLEDQSDQSYTCFGYLSIELDPPLTQQTQLSIIQHPLGQPQRVAIDGRYVSDSTREGRILYTTATNPGTSGAPVLNNYTLRAVALHNGENREAQAREGTRIKYILDVLQTEKPDLYNEIMEAQNNLGNGQQAIHRTESLDILLHSPEQNLHTSSPMIGAKKEAARSSTDQDATHSKQSAQSSFYAYKSMLDCSSPVLSLAFHPKGQYLAGGHTTGRITLWDMSTAKLSYTSKNHENATSSITFSPDGHYLASGGDDGTIILWDLHRQKVEKTVFAHAEWVSCLAFSSDGQYLVSGSDDGYIKVWEVPYGTIIHQRKESVSVFDIALYPHDQLIAFCNFEQPVKLWNRISNKTPTLKDPLSGTRSLAFSPDGRYLAAGNEKGDIFMCDTALWKTVRILAKHSGKIRCLAFHPESQLLASGGDDTTIQLWNIQNGHAIQSLAKHTDRIESLAFSPDGQFLASGGRETSIFLWKQS